MQNFRETNYVSLPIFFLNLSEEKLYILVFFIKNPTDDPCDNYISRYARFELF